MSVSEKSAGVEVRRSTQEEGKNLLDRAARHYLGMSGAAFIKAWDAGKFDANPDRPDVMAVAMLLPFGR